jgi:hypothetical protein
MGTKDARIHTGRNDRNGGTRSTNRRRTSLDYATQALATKGWEIPEDFIAALEIELEEAEARYEGLDGLHPRDEG